MAESPRGRLATPGWCHRRLGIKQRAYHRAGVEWYWLIDVKNRAVTVFQRNERSYEIIDTAADGDLVRLAPFGELDFQVNLLFPRRPHH